MRLYLLFTLFISSLLSCQEKVINYNSEVEILMKFAELDAYMKTYSDRTLVVNFWATTCPPCLKEMPHFLELEKSFPSDKLKVLLVSLDRAKDLSKRVIPFVDKNNILPEVLILDDQNYSAWTDEIDPSWYGALPATIIISGKNRNFNFGAYEKFDDLLNDVNKVISKR